MDAFVDGLVEGLLRTHHVPGAVVSVVRDGKLVFARGYGLADVERRVPMTADATLVRPGSISKLFTWTAVMQLAELRRVDLNTDIRAYVSDVPIPRFPGEPVTLAHLLTHTSGFEDRGEGLFVRSAEEIGSLRDYLKRYGPARIYPAGRVPAYSNYGSALAGYVVESVSGEPFERHVETHILGPLGMARSTFRQPPRDRTATGYSHSRGAYREESEWVRPAPTGGLATTAADMARFMIAMLDRGAAPGGARILSDSTAAAMQERRFAVDPRAGGWTYGFMETRWNGRRVLRHNGDLFHHHSGLMLLPGERAGVFVSFNATGGAAAREVFLGAYLDRFHPDSARAVPPAAPGSAADLRAHAGTYLPSRHNETGIEKLMNLQLQAVVEPAGRGLLRTVGIGSTRPAKDAFEWVEVEPRVFRRADGTGTLLFRTDPRGRVVEIVDSCDPGIVYQRQP
jgi:CubicO group peptidase (beta-lactamase class C family)